MSVKRYSSPCVKFTVNVKTAGKQIPIVFDRYNHETKRRYIDIADPLIQHLMETSPDFTVYFHLDFEDKTGERTDLVTEFIPLTDSTKTFNTVKEAKLWINENYNIPYVRISNREQLTYEYNLIGFKLVFNTILQ